MDISAIASLAPLQGLPADAPRMRDALGQEFGRMLFQMLMQGSGPASKAKGSRAMQALPLDLYSDQFARQLAVQHEQMFGQLLFGGTTKEARR